MYLIKSPAPIVGGLTPFWRGYIQCESRLQYTASKIEELFTVTFSSQSDRSHPSHLINNMYKHRQDVCLKKFNLATEHSLNDNALKIDSLIMITYICIGICVNMSKYWVEILGPVS